ncbi:MAG: DUF1501 domain-containing protein [Bryobacteraceae bacterium]
MPHFNPCQSDEPSSGLRRRDLLRAASLQALGLGMAHLLGGDAKGSVGFARPDAACILLMLVGGPSQLDTFDMKPDASSEVRGPYRPIKTNVPGIEISEIFPRTARQADKFAIIRSMHHDAIPMHDAGHQLMQTGRVSEAGIEYPHIGCVLSRLCGSKGVAPFHVLLPGPVVNTGGGLSHGQSAGFLGAEFDPFIAEPASPGPRLMPSATSEAFNLNREPESVREKYGLNRFGQSCLMARRLVEAGTRFVTVNMFQSVFDQLTWDIHGSKPFSPIGAYGGRVGPMFDLAYSALLQDLADRGLLQNTMVVATGEFGRTPRINAAGGRDHWPQCWSLLMAGGGIRGGQVIGASDETASAPKDRPTTPAEIAATIYYSFGIDPATARPIQELLI